MNRTGEKIVNLFFKIALVFVGLIILAFITGAIFMFGGLLYFFWMWD